MIKKYELKCICLIGNKSKSHVKDLIDLHLNNSKIVNYNLFMK